MSFRNRRALGIRPVNSLKHVIDITTATIGPTGQIIVDLSRTFDAPVTSSPNQVHVGSAIKAIYLKIEAITTVTITTGFPSLYFYVIKNPANEINLGNMLPDAVGVNARRKFVIHQEMMMLSKNSADNFPRTMFKGVIVIPKSYQRQGVDDRIQIQVGWSNTVDAGAQAAVCIQSIYKEFF